MSQDTIRQEVEEEAKKLIAAGTPELLARIKAASIVSARSGPTVELRDAMISHCNET